MGLLGILGEWSRGCCCNNKYTIIYLNSSYMKLKGKKDGDIAFMETVISTLMVHNDDDGLF